MAFRKTTVKYIKPVFLSSFPHVLKLTWTYKRDKPKTNTMIASVYMFGGTKYTRIWGVIVYFLKKYT